MRYLLLPFILLGPSLCQAHVRWFVGNQQNLVPYSWSLPEYLLLAIAISACLVALALSRVSIKQLTDNPFFNAWPMQLQWRILAIVVGLWLLLNVYHGEFIAPNLEPNGAWQFSLLLQAVCGVVLLISHRLASVTFCLFLLLLQLMLSVDSSLWIDYGLELAGFALALHFSAHAERAVKYLRICLGLQLIVLAVHNKLLNPGMGLAFLAQHPWNFLQMSGLTLFDDASFVVGIGLAEVSLGILLVLGIATRLVAALVIAVFTLTGTLLGIGELMGHVPIVVSFVLIFSLGAGERSFAELNPSLWRNWRGNLSPSVK